MSKVTHNQRLDLTLPRSTTDLEGFEGGTHSSSPCDVSAFFADHVSLTRGLPLALGLFAHALQVALVEGKTQHHRGHQLRLCVSNSAHTLSHLRPLARLLVHPNAGYYGHQHRRLLRPRRTKLTGAYSTKMMRYGTALGRAKAYKAHASRTRTQRHLGTRATRTNRDGDEGGVVGGGASLLILRGCLSGFQLTRFRVRVGRRVRKHGGGHHRAGRRKQQSRGDGALNQRTARGHRRVRKQEMTQLCRVSLCRGASKGFLYGSALPRHFMNRPTWHHRSRRNPLRVHAPC